LAAALADLDVAVELSSAGLRKPAADTYPSPTLLDMLVEAGTALTTASDAHEPGQIGFGFERLLAVLDARDVVEITSFRRRERMPRPLR
jgi:histidinol-phosphatase (PHP family)